MKEGKNNKKYIGAKISNRTGSNTNDVDEVKVMMLLKNVLKNDRFKKEEKQAAEYILRHMLEGKKFSDIIKPLPEDPEDFAMAKDIISKSKNKRNTKVDPDLLVAKNISSLAIVFNLKENNYQINNENEYIMRNMRGQEIRRAKELLPLMEIIKGNDIRAVDKRKLFSNAKVLTIDDGNKRVVMNNNYVDISFSKEEDMKKAIDFLQHELGRLGEQKILDRIGLYREIDENGEKLYKMGIKEKSSILMLNNNEPLTNSDGEIIQNIKEARIKFKEEREKCLEEYKNILEQRNREQKLDVRAKIKTSRKVPAEFDDDLKSFISQLNVDDKDDVNKKIAEFLGITGGVEFGENYTLDDKVERVLKPLHDLQKIIPELYGSLVLNTIVSDGARGKKNTVGHYALYPKVDGSGYVPTVSQNGSKNGGALAHEFGHHFHHIIGALINNIKNNVSMEHGVLTSLLEVNSIPYNKFDQIIAEVEKIGPHEVLDKFVELLVAIKQTNIYERSAKIEPPKGKGKEDYWHSDEEVFARVFEQYVKDRGKKMGIENTRLVKFLDPEQMGISEEKYPYLFYNEKQHVYMAMDSLMQAIGEAPEFTPPRERNKEIRKKYSSTSVSTPENGLSMTEAIKKQQSKNPPKNNLVFSKN